MQVLSDEHCGTVLEALPCYTILVDRNLRVLWANGQTIQDFGPPGGKTCRELYKIDQSKCSECPVEQTFLDSQVHSREMQFIKNDGSRVNVIMYASPLLDKQGNISSAIHVSVNITSVKELQKQLILLGETVAGMAHSIKNIMMGLEGGIYVVNKGIEAKNQDEVKEGWEMVLLNFEKISHIVKDILYCSKAREPDFEVLKPNEIVRQVYDLFKETARKYHIEVRLLLDDQLGEAVIDPSGLHTVLSNLVSNAMDACKLDIWKDSHLVEIRSRRAAEGATIIEVADNGIGIDKDLKDHVFEDFFSSKGDQGTGLGLMVTQKVMREHGGTITFRSRPGQGTTFVATFPRKALPEAHEK